jgi:hypothetical protein
LDLATLKKRKYFRWVGEMATKYSDSRSQSHTHCLQKLQNWWDGNLANFFGNNIKCVSVVLSSRVSYVLLDPEAGFYLAPRGEL